MKPPPLLPDETLHRVLRVANFDGISVLAIAGTLALASASVGDLFGAAIGLLVAAAGAIELHGAGLLRAGERRGMNWLIASQPYLAAVVLGYCALRLTSYDATLLRQAMTSDLRQSLADAGMEEEQFLRMVYTSSYAILAVGTLIYQGLMTLFYYKRRDAVIAAIESSYDASVE
jgi:hypothetical protein